DFQYIPNFISEINAGFQKNHLTHYSEYRNRGRGCWRTNGNGNETGGTGSLAARALRGSKGMCREGYVLFGCCKRSQCQVWHRLFAQRRARTGAADGTWRAGPAEADAPDGGIAISAACQFAN